MESAAATFFNIAEIVISLIMILGGFYLIFIKLKRRSKHGIEDKDGLRDKRSRRKIIFVLLTLVSLKLAISVFRQNERNEQFQDSQQRASRIQEIINSIEHQKQKDEGGGR
jgi:hypothetical protein